MENKFSQKQIANWRRVRQNIEADLIKLSKVDEKIQSMQAAYEEKIQALKTKYEEKIKDVYAEAETLRQMIDIQEAPVKVATGGFTTQEIFVKVTVVSDKVDANGRQLRKNVYSLRYPETIVPPVSENSTMGETQEPTTTQTSENEVVNEESLNM